MLLHYVYTISSVLPRLSFYELFCQVKVTNTVVSAGFCCRENDFEKKSESAQLVKDFFDKVSTCLYVYMYVHT